MKNSITFLIISFSFLPSLVFGFSASEIINNQVPAAYIYPHQFDVLVLDITIPSGNGTGTDALRAITVQNDGTAHNIREISRVFLWKDASSVGFQGMGLDEKIGEFSFNADSNSWYLNGLNFLVPASGSRIFVTVETASQPTSNTTLKFKIPALSDQNKNGGYDLGDLGVFLDSKNNGPEGEAVVNNEPETIRRFIVDNLPPKTAITNLSDGSVLTTSTFKILGMTRDEGGSYPGSVKISIAPLVSPEAAAWSDVLATSENYYTWEYNWQDIAEGIYTIKTKAADWLDNTIVSSGLTVTVKKATEEPAVSAVPPSEEITEVEKPPAEKKPLEEKPLSKMTVEELKAKIKEIEQLLVKLMEKLILLLQEQIIQTKAKL